RPRRDRGEDRGVHRRRPRGPGPKGGDARSAIRPEGGRGADAILRDGARGGPRVRAARDGTRVRTTRRGTEAPRDRAAPHRFHRHEPGTTRDGPAAARGGEAGGRGLRAGPDEPYPSSISGSVVNSRTRNRRSPPGSWTVTSSPTRDPTSARPSGDAIETSPAS